jgi:hypothetical protein
MKWGGAAMYRVVDHAHGYALRDFDTIFEAKDAAFRLAHRQAVINSDRVHLTIVVNGGKQMMKISIAQREEVR